MRNIDNNILTPYVRLYLFIRLGVRLIVIKIIKGLSNLQSVSVLIIYPVNTYNLRFQLRFLFSSIELYI